MARIKKSFFVIPSGKVGNVVFKCRKGVPYIAAMPSHYTIPDTDYYRKSVNSFSFAIGFSSALNKIKLIREIWVTPQDSAYERMLSCNMKKLRQGRLFEELSLVPQRNFFEAASSEVVFNDGSLFVTFEPVGGALSDADRWISMQGVICLENPVEINSKPYKFISFTSGDYRTEYNSPHTFEALFSGQELSLLENYNSKKIILNLITKSIKGETRKVSNTISKI
jgi:hypothetical protein